MNEVCKGIMVTVSITMTIIVNVTITNVVRALFLADNNVIRHRLEGTWMGEVGQDTKRKEHRQTVSNTGQKRDDSRGNRCTSSGQNIT